MRLQEVEWGTYQDRGLLPEELRRLVEEKGGMLGIWYGGSFWDGHGESMVGDRAWKRFWREWQRLWEEGSGMPYIKQQRLVVPNAVDS